MATTHTAPIGIDNINSSFYVHGGGYGFSSIQAAVDYVRTSAGTQGVGEVIVAHGYGYTEDINNVTGGQYSIPIKDLRDGNYITYEWDGAHYIPKDFVQYAAIVAQSKIISNALPGSTAMEYDPINPSVNGHGQINVLAKPGLGMPFMSLVLTPQDGVTPAHALLQGTAIADGTIIVKFPEKVIIAPPDTLGTGTATAWIGQSESAAGKGMSLTATPQFNSIVFQGQTAGAAFDQALSLNPQGGDVLINGVTIKPANIALLDAPNTFTQTLTINAPDETTSLWIGQPSAAGAKAMLITAQATKNVIVLQGATQGTAFDQAISLNPQGGDVLINNVPIKPATLATYPPTGIPQSTGSAWGASINPATLQGKLTLTTTGTNGPSTLAGNALNIPQYTAPAQVYPGIGIPQSTGSAWGASIDPATIQGKLSLTTTGTNGPSTLTGNVLNIPQYAGSGGGMIYPGAGIAVSSGAAWGTSINPATLATYPPTGIPQSTGSAWGTSIDPATLALTNAANTFTQPQTINGTVRALGGVSASGTSGFIASALNLQHTTNDAFLDSTGKDVSSLGGFYLRTTNSDGTTAVNAMHVLSTSIDMFGGILTLANRSIVASLTGPNINSDNSTLALNAAAGNSIFLNYDKGSYVRFGNGAGAEVGNIDSAGNLTIKGQTTGLRVGGVPPTAGYSANQLAIAVPTASNVYIDMPGANTTTMGIFHFRSMHSDGGGAAEVMTITSSGVNVTGTLTANGAKAFVVPHPLDETKDLWHSCLEGPENGVYYRGEVVTANGTAEVTLPDYFEALTYPEDRSVQLTQVFEAGAVLTMLAASRVVDGKFTVQSSAPIATVAWEVKAVRRIGVERLQVTQTKREPAPAPTFAAEEKEESTNERKQRNPKRV